jgi:hypothetical protein
MTATVRAFSRALPATQTGAETLKTIALICGAGLVVSLLLAVNGLDLGAAFF